MFVENVTTIVWLIGPPASGKTTWRKIFAGNVAVISSDDIVDDWAETKGITYTEAQEQMEWGRKYQFTSQYCSVLYDSKIFGKMKAAFKDAVSKKLNIIIDLTNLKRRRFMDNAVPEGYYKIAVVFDIEKELLMERLEKRRRETGKYIPQYVIENMISSYVPPSEDFFDLITVLKQE